MTDDTPPSSNETPESAPATANPEGVVTAHEQEEEAATESDTREKTSERTRNDTLAED
jgi:hypothetical protein